MTNHVLKDLGYKSSPLQHCWYSMVDGIEIYVAGFKTYFEAYTYGQINGWVK